MSSLTPVRQSAWLRLESNPWVVIGSILAGLAVGELAPKLALSLEVVGDIPRESMRNGPLRTKQLTL